MDLQERIEAQESGATPQPQRNPNTAMEPKQQGFIKAVEEKVEAMNMEKQKPELVLSDNEKKMIENQRMELETLERFKLAYEHLVQQTGYAWAVDMNSTIGSPRMGIVKIR